MMKNVDWWEYGGSAAQALLVDYVDSGKLPFLKGTPNLDIYTDLAVVAADLFFSDRFYGTLGSVLDGAAVYAAGDAIGKVVKKVIPGIGGTTGTGADFNFVAAQAPAPALSAPSAFGETPDLSAYAGL